MTGSPALFTGLNAAILKSQNIDTAEAGNLSAGGDASVGDVLSQHSASSGAQHSHVAPAHHQAIAAHRAEGSLVAAHQVHIAG